MPHPMKKNGLTITSVSKLPVNKYLIFLAEINWSGVTIGNSVHSPIKTMKKINKLKKIKTI